MPFTLVDIEADLEDPGPRFDGAPDLELRVTQEEAYGGGAPNLGDDPRDDVDGRRHWWAD